MAAITGTHPIYKAVSTPGTLKELHNAEFDDSCCRQCNFLLTPIWSPFPCMAFEFWNKRAYHRVYENRLESNTPLVNCCPMDACLTDMVSVKFFDKDAKFAPWKRATCCTPFHSMCVVECQGEVAATAKQPWQNNCCFPCFRSYAPGLKDAQAFCDAANAAQAQALAAVMIADAQVMKK
jgi:hypothetical protein